MEEKPRDKKLKTGDILSIFLVIGLFIAAAVFAKQYEYLLKELPYFHGYTGMALYILVTVFAIVAAPISTFPLLPLAVSLWGSFIAAILSIIGWTIGAAIAFWLARRFGKPLIGKIMPLEKIRKIEKFIPKNNIFISIILLRMTLPVDVLSYALGLFSSVPLPTYLFATVIGVSPFAFFFSYLTTLPIGLGLLLVVLAIVVLLAGYKRLHKS